MFFLFRQSSASFAGPAWGSSLIVNGLLCILFGFAIILAPELLAYIVAAFLLLAGSLLVALGFRMRRWME